MQRWDRVVGDLTRVTISEDGTSRTLKVRDSTLDMSESVRVMGSNYPCQDSPCQAVHE